MKEKIWRCTCGGAHFLSIIQNNEDPWHLYVNGRFEAPNLRARIKTLWKLLRHGHYDSWVEIILDREAATEIRHELADFLRDERG